MNITQLPNDILSNIYLHSSPESNRNLTLTCRRMREICNNNIELLEQAFNKRKDYIETQGLEWAPEVPKSQKIHEINKSLINNHMIEAYPLRREQSDLLDTIQSLDTLHPADFDKLIQLNREIRFHIFKQKLFETLEISILQIEDLQIMLTSLPTPRLNKILVIAAETGYWEIIDSLVQAGANVHTADPAFGQTPLSFAIHNNHLGAIHSLIKNGANVQHVDSRGNTFSHQARSVYALRLLMRHGVNINTNDGWGRSTLHAAVFFGNETAIVRTLIQKGISVHQTVRDDEHILHLAIEPTETKTNEIDLVRILLENGANPNVVDRQKHTPLHLAAENNSPEIMNLLISKGALVDVLDVSRSTALHKLFRPLNRKEGSILPALHLLVRAGAAINAQDCSGETPLHLALDQPIEVIQYLLAAGADPLIKNEYGEKPLDFLVESGVIAKGSQELQFLERQEQLQQELAKFRKDMQRQRLSP